MLKFLPVLISLVITVICYARLGWWGFWIMFPWIGASISIGIYLRQILPREKNSAGRRISILLIMPLFNISAICKPWKSAAWRSNINCSRWYFRERFCSLRYRKNLWPINLGQRILWLGLLDCGISWLVANKKRGGNPFTFKEFTVRGFGDLNFIAACSRSWLQLWRQGKLYQRGWTWLDGYWQHYLLLVGHSPCLLS